MIMDIDYILNNSAGNLYWKDIHGRYSGANQSFIDLMNAQIHDDFVGKTDRQIFFAVMTDEKLKIIEETDQRIIKTGNTEYIKEEGVDILGNIAFYFTKKMPLKKDGEIVGIMGTSLDITKEVFAEDRAQKAELSNLIFNAKAVSEEEMRKTVMVLVGDIVHDLRTPIATIRTITSLLNDILPCMIKIIDEAKELGAKQINLLSHNQFAFLRGNKFVIGLDNSVKMMDDFIKTSLIELNVAQNYTQNNLHLLKCSSRRILERTLEAYPFDNDIKLNERISYDFDLMGNSILIMKVLFNLIRNAIDQIHLNGKGEIFITTEELNDTNLVKIKDTAGGAHPDVIPNLFIPYYTTKKEGTGIGLAFSKDIMKKFGGDLTYNNIYGQHMEFILSFPKIKTDHDNIL